MSQISALENQLSYMEQAKSFANDELSRLRDENLQLQTLFSNRENDTSARDFLFHSSADGEESSRREKNAQLHSVKLSPILQIAFETIHSFSE